MQTHVDVATGEDDNGRSLGADLAGTPGWEEATDVAGADRGRQDAARRGDRRQRAREGASGCCSPCRCSAWSTRPSRPSQTGHPRGRGNAGLPSADRRHPAGADRQPADTAAPQDPWSRPGHHRRGAPLVHLHGGLAGVVGVAAGAFHRTVGDAVGKRAWQALRRPDRGSHDSGADRQRLSGAIQGLCALASGPRRGQDRRRRLP